MGPRSQGTARSRPSWLCRGAGGRGVGVREVGTGGGDKRTDMRRGRREAGSRDRAATRPTWMVVPTSVDDRVVPRSRLPFADWRATWLARASVVAAAAGAVAHAVASVRGFPLAVLSEAFARPSRRVGRRAPRPGPH